MSKKKIGTSNSIHSMLKTTLSSHEDIDVSSFSRLKRLVKNCSKGYQPKKALTLRWDQIENYLKNAPDEIDLAHKVNLMKN